MQTTLNPLLPHPIVMDVLADTIKKEREIKVIQIEKEDIKLSLFTDDMTIYLRKS